MEKDHSISSLRASPRCGFLPVWLRHQSEFAAANRPVPRGLLPSRQNGRLLLMIDWSQCPAVERQPSKVSGAWVFKGTRVPVRALFENLQGGARVEDFLEWFPGVTREQVN